MSGVVVSFAEFLGTVARSRSLLPGHGEQPSPALFEGDALLLWERAYRGLGLGAAAADFTVEQAVLAGERCGRLHRPIANPWRAGTDFYAAWQRGYAPTAETTITEPDLGGASQVIPATKI